MFFVIFSTKLGWLWWSSVHRLLNKFATKSCKRFPLHLHSVPALPCETWNDHRTSATVELLQKDTTEFISEFIYRVYISTVASKLARVESNCLLHVRNIATEGVQNTRRWCGRIETATENGVDPAAGHVIIAATISQWRLWWLQISDACFAHLLLQYFSYSVINWIQIWRIWGSQLRWDKFWSFFL